MRYYFDYRANGDVAVDNEGLELPDASAARREATRALSDATRDALLRSAFPESIIIEVRDDNGPVAQAHLTIEEK
jgi:hypothetical protein